MKNRKVGEVMKMGVLTVSVCLLSLGVLGCFADTNETGALGAEVYSIDFDGFLYIEGTNGPWLKVTEIITVETNVSEFVPRITKQTIVTRPELKDDGATYVRFSLIDDPDNKTVTEKVFTRYQVKFQYRGKTVQAEHHEPIKTTVTEMKRGWEVKE